MRLHTPLGDSWRRRLAALCLTIFGVAGAARYDWRKLPRFLEGCLRGPRESTAQARASGTGFWFDRDYPAFLEALRKATPPDATIAVALPATPDVYLYQAVFTLAPRRVVALKDGASAGYVAYYRDAALSQSQGLRIAGGVLVRR
ncbi:MAG: hypothetical protein ACRD00_04910 [Thermoanaerobaculia bacterium]